MKSVQYIQVYELSSYFYDSNYGWKNNYVYLLRIII